MKCRGLQQAPRSCAAAQPAVALKEFSRHGVKGIAMAGWRILRCNPWSLGGVDYVDEHLDCADAVHAHTKELVGAK